MYVNVSSGEGGGGTCVQSTLSEFSGSSPEYGHFFRNLIQETWHWGTVV